MREVASGSANVPRSHFPHTAAFLVLASAILTGGILSRTFAGQPMAAESADGAATHLEAAHPLLKSAPPQRTAREGFGAPHGDWQQLPANQFVASAERGTGRRRETWLGTPVGVKCADRRTGQMHHYTRRDGLPANAIAALAADRDGVWCVTHDGPAVTLCAFDAPTNRWRVVQTAQSETLSSGDPRYYSPSYEMQTLQAQARPLLATSPRWVAFTSGAVSYHTDTVVRLIDKRTGAVTPVPWDAALRADNNYLGPIALAFAGDNDLLLGTNLGLLRWNIAEKRWHRYLPRTFVESLATTNGETVWAVGQARSPNGRVYSATRPTWTLGRVSLTNGQSAEWAPPANGAPRTAARLGRGALFDESDQQNLRLVPPVGVSVAPDGAIWTSHASEMGLEGSFNDFVDFHGRAGQHGGFERFDPQTATWTAYPLRLIGKPDAAPNVLVGGTGETGAIGLDNIPDAAVLPVARIYTADAYRYARANLFWVRQRYPEWICPDAR